MNQITITPRQAVLGVIMAIVGFMIFGSISCIKDGQVGVVSDFGSLRDTPLGGGMKYPGFWTTITTVSTFGREQHLEVAYSDPHSAPTADKLNLGFHVEVNWNVNGEFAVLLCANYGYDDTLWGDKVITSIIPEALKDVTVQRNLANNMVHRQDVATETLARLRQRVHERLTGKDPVLEGAITVIQVNIIAFDPPPEVRRAIIAKQEADENVMRAELELLEAAITAQRAVKVSEAARDSAIARANGNAQATLINARANLHAYLMLRQAGVNPTDWLYYNNWNGELPRVVAGNAGGLMIPAGEELTTLTEEDVQFMLNEMDSQIAELDANFEENQRRYFPSSEDTETDSPETSSDDGETGSDDGATPGN